MRLLLISHAALGGSPNSASLSDGARARAAEVGRALPTPRAAYASPATETVQTAQALGLVARVDDELRDWDQAGETVDELIVRVAGWLDRQVDTAGTRAAVTHSAVINAAIAAALLAPAAFGHVDVAPCSVTEFSFRVGRWHLAHVNWESELLHIPQRARRRTRPQL